MRLDYEITYMSCGSCTEKTHCDECGERLAGIIAGFDGVRSARINMPAKSLTVEMDEGADEDDLIDAMEAIGVFA